jgi:hypothetical protein
MHTILSQKPSNFQILNTFTLLCLLILNKLCADRTPTNLYIWILSIFNIFILSSLTALMACARCGGLKTILFVRRKHKLIITTLKAFIYGIIMPVLYIVAVFIALAGTGDVTYSSDSAKFFPTETTTTPTPPLWQECSTKTIYRAETVCWFVYIKYILYFSVF